MQFAGIVHFQNLRLPEVYFILLELKTNNKAIHAAYIKTEHSIFSKPTS